MGNVKRRLDSEQLRALLSAAGIRWPEVHAYEPLAGGTFNTVHRVCLVDGTCLVLKVSPEPSAPILQYEHRIMRTEALFYDLARRCDAPVPTVLYAGFDEDVIAGDFLLMSECPGRPWQTVTKHVSAAEHRRLRGQLGRIVASLHTLVGTGFGYPTQVPMSLAADWRTAFLAMMAAVLADADRFGVRLPVRPEEIWETVLARAEVLDEITAPVLVHFDLWDGNILLDLDGGMPRLGGLIDAERAFWGDPLADFVSLALLGDIEQDAAFLSGYRSAGGRVIFDLPSRQRLSLYRSYLYTIMLVEAVPRGSDRAHRQWLEHRVRPALVGELDALSLATGAGGRRPEGPPKLSRGVR